MVEYSVKMLHGVSVGTDVRPVGCDIAAGQRVLESATRLGSSELGLLAAVGVKQACVISRPIVGVLSTGNEVSHTWVCVLTSLHSELSSLYLSWDFKG